MKRRQFVLNAAALGGVLYAADIQALGGTAISTGHVLRGGLWGTSDTENEKDVVAGNIVTSRTEIEWLRKRGLDPHDAMEHKMQILRTSFLEYLTEHGML